MPRTHHVSRPATRLHTAVVLVLLSPLTGVAAGRELPLPTDLGERVLVHASTLAEMGPRPAGSPGESAAVAYVVEELRQAGLSADVEGFSYDRIDIADTSLLLAGDDTEALLVAFDPSRPAVEEDVEAVPAPASADPPPGVAGHIVVADHPLMQLLLLEQAPAAVVTVSEEALARFIEQPSRAVSLRVEHETRAHSGANVVATLGPASSDRRILVTAHLDAYQTSPGANDNGTGLGALIELARILRPAADQLPVPITFVAFGAEEIGAVGSRAYLDRHAGELEHLVAVVNLDTLGGADGPQIGAAPGVRGVPADGRRSQIPPELDGRAWEDSEGRWRMNHAGILPYVATSCYPEWLQAVVAGAASELGLEPRQRSLMSDHSTFAQAGVPAISIQSGEHTIHTDADTADALVPATVEAGTRLAATILWHLEQGGGERPERRPHDSGDGSM